MGIPILTKDGTSLTRYADGYAIALSVSGVNKEDILLVVKTTAGVFSLDDVERKKYFGNTELRKQLEKIENRYGLDYNDLVSIF